MIFFGGGDRISCCSLGQPEVYCVVQASLESPRMLVPHCPKCYEYRRAPHTEYGKSHIVLRNRKQYNHQSIMTLNEEALLGVMQNSVLKGETNGIILHFPLLFPDENLQLVNHEASSVAVDVVPHVDNPTFEEDESPNQETAVREIKS